MTFAEQLKAARAAAGLTQQGLADVTHIPKRTLQDWEYEHHTPPEYVQYLVLEKISTYKDKPQD